MEGRAQEVDTRDTSNDCRNCRRKGLSCDQNHPACQQCLQRGLHCRPLVNRGGPSAWRVSNPTTPTADVQLTRSASTEVPASSAFQNVQPAAEPRTTPPAPGNEPASVLTPPVPVTLNLAGFKDSVEASWMFDHYTHRPELQGILIASSSQSFGAAAAAAATAMSATLFAKFHNISMWPHSLPLQAPYCNEYAMAVQALSKQIPLFKVSELEQVMVPALLLLIAESWLVGQSREHYLGLEQLLRTSGTALFHGSRLDLFFEVRSAMTWYAASRGERTIFSEEWWKMAPFAMATSSKTPTDHLVDCMADIGSLLADAKQTQFVALEQPSTATGLRARAILHQLFSWRWSWLARNSHGAYEVDAPDNEAFGTLLRYQEPQLMYEIWLCNALVILVMGFLNPLDLRKERAATFASTGPLWKPSEALAIQQPAVEICRSLDYMLQNPAAPAPVHQWAMPVALAYVTLSPIDPVAVGTLSKVLAASESRRTPWLCFIKRLQGRDPDAAKDLFGCWPVNRR